MITRPITSALTRSIARRITDPVLMRSRDTLAPVVTLTSLTTNNRRPALAGTVDDPTASIAVTVAGTTYPGVNAGTGTWSLAADTIASLADGTHPASVTATDAAGNVGTASGSIYVDATAPAVTVTAISLTKFRQPALSGTVNDPTATVVASIGGNAYPATITGSTWTVAAGTVLELGDGTHTVNVTATDPLGNVGTASGTVKVDATAPALTLTTSAAYFSTAQLTGTVNDSTATVQVIVGGLSYPATISGSTWTTTAAVPLALGNNSVQVQATDPAGNIGSVSGTVYRFDPQLLFAGGEPGWFFEQHDLSTQFADVTGTTPITGANQSVALQLDKSRGLVLGPELVANGEFESSHGWVATSTTPTYSDGKVSITAGASYANVGRSLSSSANTFLVEVDIDSTTGGAQGVVNLYDSANVTEGATAMLRFAAGKHRFIARMNGLSYVRVRVQDAGQTVVYSRLSVRELPGNHRIQPTAASRPMLRQDATTGLRYYEWDAQDDWMQTAASVDFSGTDKVTVACGLRKLSDAATGSVVELSADWGTNNGTFAIRTPSSSGAPNYLYAARVASQKSISPVSAAYAAPQSAVVSLSADASAEVLSARHNGVAVTGAVGTMGTGNYGNHIAYFSSRGGTALRFNGHTMCDFAIGRLLTPTELMHLERWVASRTPGVVLAA